MRMFAETLNKTIMEKKTYAVTVKYTTLATAYVEASSKEEAKESVLDYDESDWEEQLRENMTAVSKEINEVPPIGDGQFIGSSRLGCVVSIEHKVGNQRLNRGEIKEFWRVFMSTAKGKCPIADVYYNRDGDWYAVLADTEDFSPDRIDSYVFGKWDSMPSIYQVVDSIADDIPDCYRTCSVCGKPFNSGYLLFNEDYACCNECKHEIYKREYDAKDDKEAEEMYLKDAEEYDCDVMYLEWK